MTKAERLREIAARMRGAAQLARGAGNHDIAASYAVAWADEIEAALADTKAERDFFEAARAYAAIMEADHRNTRHGETIGKRIQDARNAFFETHAAMLTEEEKHETQE